MISPPRFNMDDMVRASDEWGANCGPGALAAICGMTLDEVRHHVGDFETKRYTNPTLMFASLRSTGVRWLNKPLRCGGKGGWDWPRYGLCRVQWEGPWTKPGVPMRARYRHTHWIGSCARSNDDIGVFDINALANGSGWSSLKDWREILVPWLLSEVAPNADGKWHLTHAIEVER